MAESRAEDLAALSDRFFRFAEFECGDYAPTYDRLARVIARTDRLLSIAAAVPAGRTVPNTFLAATNLLFGPRLPEFSESEFIEACLRHERALRDLCSTKLVQTNEVRRSSALLPALSYIASRVDAPLALVEPGASAGLLLRFDRYRIDYGEVGRTGPENAAVAFPCEARGALPPTAWDESRLVGRFGIDLSPVHTDDTEAIAWLRALVWPDHSRRLALLDAALHDMASDPVELVAGDALEALPRLLASLPAGVFPVAFHIAMLAHFTADARVQFEDMITSLATARAGGVAWLRSEAVEPMARWLDLDLFLPGKRREGVRLARIHPHGEWIEWMAGA